MKADCIATGHNADDIAETVLMNVLRGDIARLQRCTSVITVRMFHIWNKKEKKKLSNDVNFHVIQTGADSIMRCKPLKYAYEKEIVMYAYFKKLVYFSTECIYAPNAYRGHARAFLKDLEKIRPSSIIDIIHSGKNIRYTLL